MRFLLLITPLFFSLALAATDHKTPVSEKRIANPYWIVGSVVDSALDEQHALFELQFNGNLNAAYEGYSVPAKIEFSCNGVIRQFDLDSTLKTTVLVSPGTYRFQLAVINGQYFEITTDSIAIDPAHKTTVFINFQSSEPGVIYLKPVLYFYSEQDRAIHVRLQPKGDFGFTYPAYPETGWNGTAHADGSITVDGTRYPYLFWEGTNGQANHLANYTSGFVVTQSEVIPFLEEKLTAMGLNAKEKTDLITFWGPRMTQSELGFVRFLFNEDYDQIASLTIEPAPQEIFRVYLLWTPLEDVPAILPQPQIIPSAKRQQFYAIEWGGSEIPLLTPLSFTH